MKGGRFTLDRKIFDWEWWGDDNTTITFLTLIGLANYKDNTHRGKLIKRGQVVCSLESLARDSRRSVQKIRTSLNKLISTGEVVVEPTNKGTVITIVNYDKYQVFNTVNQSDQQATNTPVNKPSTRQLTTTNKGNKEKKVITTTAGDIFSFSTGGENADLRSSERDTWTTLCTLWKTNEYEVSNNKTFRTYWSKMSAPDRNNFIEGLKGCRDPRLEKIWKKDFFADGYTTFEQLQLEINARPTPPTDKKDDVKNKAYVYINRTEVDPQVKIIESATILSIINKHNEGNKT